MYVLQFSGVSEAILAKDSVFQPVLTSLNTVGLLSIYMGSVIAGAEVYQAIRPQMLSGSATRLPSPFAEKEARSRIDRSTMFAIAAVRLVFLPKLARFLYSASGLKHVLVKDVLGLFVMQQMNVVTSNISILIVSMLAANGYLRNSGTKRDVAAVLFVQLLVAPVLLTVNSAMAVGVQFSTQ